MRKHCRDCFSLQRGSGNRAASHIRFAVRMSRQSRQTPLVGEERSFTPPTDANAIQAVTPIDMYSWPGPDIRLTQQSERTGIENKWFALTARVVALKAETDGDLHIALQDATGDKPGIVVVECQQNRSGVQFVKRFLVGRVGDSRFTPTLRKNLRSINLPSSPLSAKCSGTLDMLPKTNQTGVSIFRGTLLGKFTR